jgi:hypothetical protein
LQLSPLACFPTSWHIQLLVPLEIDLPRNSSTHSSTFFHRNTFQCESFLPFLSPSNPNIDICLKVSLSIIHHTTYQSTSYFSEPSVNSGLTDKYNTTTTSTMCMITTSHPCPEPDVDELVHRLRNTRKIVQCNVTHMGDDRPSSCAGEVLVQHHNLGQSDLCSWCSMTAKLKYAGLSGGNQRKRKARDTTGNEEDLLGEDDSQHKRAKVG